jgi:hypothetical protein
VVIPACFRSRYCKYSFYSLSSSLSTVISPKPALKLTTKHAHPPTYPSGPHSRHATRRHTTAKHRPTPHPGPEQNPRTVSMPAQTDDYSGQLLQELSATTSDKEPSNTQQQQQQQQGSSSNSASATQSSSSSGGSNMTPAFLSAVIHAAGRDILSSSSTRPRGT